MSTDATVVGAVVGIDGCGKSSAFHGALGHLARHVDIVGIGDEVLAGAPGIPVHERGDLPLHQLTSDVGRIAKRTRRAWAYRQLKSLDLIGRSRMRDHVVREEAPPVLLTDGDPLVNTLAWSVGRLYRDELLDDDGVVEALGYLAGERRIPLSRLPYYLRHAWQLAVVNRLHIARFAVPDLVVLLRLDAGEAMDRIRRRGRPLQTHETEAALAALGAGYDRVCGLMEAHMGVRVVRIPVGRTDKASTAHLVAEALLELVPEPPQPRLGDADAAPIEVIATTISGSLKDQRKIGRIGPRFAALTRRPTRIHAVDSHEEAREVTRGIVARGGRIIVSAGGAGTFNAVLEGCHQSGRIPSDVRLAFLRKGSADLIGKALRIPDELDDGVGAIVDGIELDRRVEADILTVGTNQAGADASIRHLVGFGGLGIFGVVPRFTEARWVRLYKGILGSLFGDYGPFYVGLALATMWWYAQRFCGRVAPLSLELDDERVGAAIWTAVIVVNGDLGPAFPLGRGLSFASGTFRVVAMKDMGPLQGLRQLAAARTGAIIDEPERYGCLVREVCTFDVRLEASGSTRSADATMLNVDGLGMLARGAVHFSTSGRVELIAGPEQRASSPRAI